MANERVYLSLVLVLTACTYHPAPVIIHDTQEQLIKSIREEGYVLHPQAETVCAGIEDAPLGIEIGCPYGFHHWEPEGFVIEVWKDAPIGVACAIAHERKHIVDGKSVEWHEGKNHEC